MAVDWLAIRNDYINGGGSYRKLAEKYGVDKSTIAEKGKEENWKQLRDIQTDRTRTKTALKTEEKISDYLSDEAAAEAEARALAKRLGLQLLKEVERSRDTNDYRRIVQCLSDMGVFDKDGSENAGGVIIVDDIPKQGEID